MSTATHKGEVVRTSEAAVLFRFADDDVERWVPRSVCTDGDVIETGDTDIVVKTWWAEKEGLE